MKYLGFDHLYNLDKDKVAKYIFTYSGVECVLLFPRQRNNVILLAISRECILTEMRIPFVEKEYDIMEIDFPFDYEYREEDVLLSNETSVKRYVSEIAESIHQIQKSAINIISLQSIADKRELDRVLKEDLSSQYSYQGINEFLSIELLAETDSYVIRDNRGNDLLTFNFPKYAKRGFTLLCDGIFRYLKGLLS